MIFSTGQCKLIRDMGYLVNFVRGLQGLNSLKVFAGTRIEKLVSVLIVLIFINTCPDLVAIEKNIAREPPKLIREGNNTGNKQQRVRRT